MQKFIVISAFLVAAIACMAQSKRAETSLAGVNLGAPITEVRRVLGDPIAVVDSPIKDVAWRAGEREYDFVRGKVSVKVFEAYYQKPGMQSEHSSGVFSISIQGDASTDRSVRTGRGLALGDSVQTIKKLYSKAPKVKNHVQLRWDNGNILDINLGPHGRISEIELRIEEE